MFVLETVGMRILAKICGARGSCGGILLFENDEFVFVVVVFDADDVVAVFVVRVVCAVVTMLERLRVNIHTQK